MAHVIRAAMRRLPAALAALLVLFPGGAFPAGDVEAAPSEEYQVKAVFLYNFVQFVQWPAETFPEKNSPLVVCILGDDPFKSYLDDVVKDEKVEEHPIQVVRYGRIEDAKVCHLLFVSASETRKLPPILASLKSRKVLTVGESESFSRQGGMVSFITRDGKIRLKVNLGAVQAADLTVSAKLLRLAEIVPPGKG